MKYLYTLDELLSIRTNGWSCSECGAAWLDTTAGLAVPVTRGMGECSHSRLSRAMITAPT